MNARQRCRERRQMRYREQCRIRQIKFNLIQTANARSTEEIIDDIWRDYSTEDNALINFILSFKRKLADHPSSSINNRCLTKTYLYTVKNRYRRRRKPSQTRRCSNA